MSVDRSRRPGPAANLGAQSVEEVTGTSRFIDLLEHRRAAFPEPLRRLLHIRSIWLIKEWRALEKDCVSPVLMPEERVGFVYALHSLGERNSLGLRDSTGQ